MEEDVAVERLRQIIYEDPTFPFEYSEQLQSILILEKLPEFAPDDNDKLNGSLDGEMRKEWD